MKDTTEFLTELSEDCVNIEEKKKKKKQKKKTTSFALRNEKTWNCFRVPASFSHQWCPFWLKVG